MRRRYRLRGTRGHRPGSEDARLRARRNRSGMPLPRRRWAWQCWAWVGSPVNEKGRRGCRGALVVGLSGDLGVSGVDDLVVVENGRALRLGHLVQARHEPIDTPGLDQGLDQPVDGAGLLELGQRNASVRMARFVDLT